MNDFIGIEKATIYNGPLTAPSNFPSSQGESANLECASELTTTADNAEYPNDLRMVIARWTDLPETIQQRILGLVEGAIG